MSVVTCFSLVATRPSYLGIPGTRPQDIKFKYMDNVHIFLRQQSFLLICFMSAAPMVRLSFFMHTNFLIETSRVLLSLLALFFFLYERNRETQNTGFVLFMALDIFFRVAAHNYDKNFRRALKLKIKLLRVRP